MTNQPAPEPARHNLQVLLTRHLQSRDRLDTSIEQLSLFQATAPTDPLPGMLYEPSICVVVQGAKRITLGSDTFVYNSGQYLLTSLHLPTVVQVIEASPEVPCLGLRLKFDLGEVALQMAHSGLPAPRVPTPGPAMGEGRLTAALLDALARLVALLDTPEDIPVLAPIIRQEIIYRLLTGDQGPRLRQMASTGSQSQQIARAVEHIRQHFHETLSIDELARLCGMSPSTFHQHFKTLTAMSPLQYQKSLRLQEARRRLLSDVDDVASAAFGVGYESPSQFSREYSRMFGAPPSRDISRLREMAVG